MNDNEFDSNEFVDVDMFDEVNLFEEVEDEMDYFDAFDDADALASAGWGTDEDYNGYCYNDDY